MDASSSPSGRSTPPRAGTSRITACSSLLALCLAAAPAAAEPAHRLLGHEPQPEGEGRSQSGYLQLGHYPGNRGEPAARPDGTGSAWALYRLYLMDSLRGDSAGMLADLLFLTDRDRGAWLSPTQMDYLLGLSLAHGLMRLQVDREESLALDRPGGGYRAWDLRLSVPFGAAETESPVAPPGHLRRLRDARPEVRGLLTAGYYLHNSGRPVRPDSSGLALSRWAARADLLWGGGLWRASLTADFLSDERRRRHVPAAMDLTLEAAARFGGVELALARESLQSLDGPGYAARWLASLRIPFDSRRSTPGTPR